MAEEGPRGNQRRWERRALHVSVTLVHGDGREVRGHVDNIGSGGAFFTTDDLEMRIVEEDAVALLFTRSENHEIRIEGRVLRIDTFFSGQSVLRTLAVRFETPLPPGEYPLLEESPSP